MEDIRLKDSAKEMAVVAQFNEINFDCNVEDIVMLGRSPHISFLQSEKQNDFDIVKAALKDVGMLDKANRSYSSLSGGEKQRLSIARAMMKSAPIIILDEATANVDPENEKELMQAIEELTRKKTVIMIAHRLKTVRNADKIVVIDEGRIVQEGKHEELIKTDGIYNKFVNARELAVSWKIS